MSDHATVWDNCLQMIRKQVPTQSFETWFKPIVPVRLTGGALTIQVPDRIYYEMLEEHYVSLLKTSIRKELGDTGRLEYQFPAVKAAVRSGREALNGALHKTGLRKPNPTQPGNVNTDNIKNPFVIPGIKRDKIEPQLNPLYTFANYIEGDCNRLARSAGVAVAQRPGATSFNPLVVYGDTGLGKTHLVQAIGNEVVRRFPNKNVLYVSSEKFTNQMIESIRNNATNDFVNFYQSIDVLIMDDIHWLANRQKTQDIFFHIFNQLHQTNKQIIITSDKPPRDLEGITERLLSRFKWGLTADIQEPDLETRMAILEARMSREGVDAPKEVVEYLSYNIKSNIRELEGALISLTAQASFTNRNIDVELAKEVVRNYVSQVNKEITVEYIQQIVAEHFNLPIDKIQGQTRKRAVVEARQLSMYLAKKHTDQSLKAIGQCFGGRDHSTVIYSCRTVQDLMEVNSSFKETVAELEKKVKMGLNG